MAAGKRLAMLAVMSGLCCASCSFFKPRADPTMFFVLTVSPSSAVTAGGAQRVIGLGPIRLPEYLDRPQLVTRVAPNQLRISEVERWAEPLGDALASTLRQDLAAALPNDTIVLQPWDMALHPEAEIEIEVVRFERISDRAVELAVHWKLRDGTGHLRLAKDSQIQQATADPDAQSAIAALSQTLSKLGHELAVAVGGLGG